MTAKNKTMKLQFILVCLFFTIALSSCKKCVTCVPYTYSMGVIDTTADSHAQAIKLCDERDIKAYESLTDFTDGTGDTARFICK